MKAVVGYYASWAAYRTGTARYTVDDIPVNKYTHLVYAFAVLSDHSYTAVQHDSNLDGSNYRAFVNLKRRNPGLKVLLGLGGWTDSHGSNKYSRLVSSSERRRNFVRSVVDLLQEYGFDGLDLDWEYPGAGDEQGFTALIKELKSEFRRHHLMLTISISACLQENGGGYNFPAIVPHLDLIMLMTYDFHGSWSSSVNHPAPLSSQPRCHTNYNVKAAVGQLQRRGVPNGKIVVGLPFYGVSWTLQNRGMTSPGDSASGPGQAGPLLNERATKAYYEVCLAKKQEHWTDRREDGGCYMFRGDQWVAYDDPETLRRKAQYVQQQGLGGVMIWDITTDDFRGHGGQGQNPLIAAVSSTLIGR